MKSIKIGTRDSPLALWQAQYVMDQLSSDGSILFEVVSIRSQGDEITEIPLEKLEGKGFFTKELDQALLDGKIDIAVHSLKDIPTELPNGLELTSVTRRYDPRDVLIGAHAKKSKKIQELPPGATLATGSLRRRSQLLAYRPDLNIVGLRGNLQTRYKKLAHSEWDGMILARAGVDRLKLSETITEKIPLEILLPPPGQGSLGIMSRKGERRIRYALHKIEDKNAKRASLAERAFLSHIGGGCTSPIACYCQIKQNRVHLEAFVGNLRGSAYLREKMSGSLRLCEETGVRLAGQMLDMGAKKILSQV